MRIFLFYFILFLMLTTKSFASAICQLSSFASEPSVFSKSGNIFYHNSTSDIIQITRSGKDSSPVLSPNKKIIAFVRIGNQNIPESCDIDAKYGNEIWLYDFSIKKEKRLVKSNFECNNPAKRIVDPDYLSFSPDSKTLYFETSAWVTSGAVHAISVNGNHLRFVTDGNEFHIVQSGPYKGDLIVNQHRYRFKGDTPLGSYDWDWLVTPTGKQIRLYRKEG